MVNVVKGRVPCAYRGFIYGVPGIGKSTWAASSPHPIFINCEDGLNRIDCDKTDHITEYEELVDTMRWFYGSEYKTAVIDTADAVEQMINRCVCAKHGWKSIEAPGFGKGWVAAQETWNEFLDICDKLCRAGKNTLWVGHDIIKNHAAPDTDAYDRYLLKLNQKIAGTIVGRMDFVFFAQYEALVKNDKTKDERVRAVGTGRRVLRTQECPAWIAKNRFGLEPTLPMDGTVFEKLS